MMRARDWVALVLALTAGGSVLLLTGAAFYTSVVNPNNTGLSEGYESLLTGTLGVLIGALAGYIGGTRHPDHPDADPIVDPDMPAETAGTDPPGQTPPPRGRHLSESDKPEGTP